MLIPLLADKYLLIAPDYPGFGHRDAPPPETFSYTFEHLSEYMGKFMEQLGLARYSLYFQDYGGPMGFRLAIAPPGRVTALIIQNAVVHIEGCRKHWTSERRSGKTVQRMRKSCGRRFSPPTWHAGVMPTTFIMQSG